MKFSTIYEQAIVHWPDQVLVADGEPSGTNGYGFPTLSKAWDKAERAANSVDEWTALAVWCMYQAFHSEAKRIRRAGEIILRPREVSKLEVEKRLAKNLLAEGWSEYRESYENDLDLA